MRWYLHPPSCFASTTSRATFLGFLRQSRHLALFKGERAGNQVLRGRPPGSFDVCLLHQGARDEIKQSHVVRMYTYRRILAAHRFLMSIVLLLFVAFETSDLVCGDSKTARKRRCCLFACFSIRVIWYILRSIYFTNHIPDCVPQILSVFLWLLLVECLAGVGDFNSTCSQLEFVCFRGM